MSDDDEGVSLGTVTVVTRTDNAVLVRNSDDEEEWIPFSQVHDDSEIYEDNSQTGETGKLVITEWLAGQKGYL